MDTSIHLNYADLVLLIPGRWSQNIHIYHQTIS